MKPRSLIIGCGYLGTVLAERLVRAGHELQLVTRSAERAVALRKQFGEVVATLDVARSEADEALARLAAQASHAFVLLTPSALQDSFGTLAPLQRITAALEASAALECAVLSSSTAVYGLRAGALVTAETPCSGGSAREDRLLAIEAAWRAGPSRKIVRLAGLYGPGRIIGAQSLRAGVPVDGDPAAWLNLIHVVDAADLLRQCLSSAAAGIELGCDGTPVARRVYYDTLAAMLGCRLPVYSGAPAARGGASRRCDPRSTQDRTGWQPMFRDFRAGLISAPGIFSRT